MARSWTKSAMCRRSCRLPRPPRTPRPSDMPPELIARTVTAELRVRAAAEGERERIVEGRIVPFGRVATVRDSPGGPTYREAIARGATANLDPTAVLFDYLT